MQFYSDMVKNADGGELFKKNLFKIIELSKTISHITYAASNAVTILNAAQISFVKQLWDGIRIPEANLFKEFLHNTDLRGANLSGVNFTSAYLKNCNFEEAVMKDVQFGVFPDLKCGDKVYCVVMSKKGNLLACGCGNGEV